MKRTVFLLAMTLGLVAPAYAWDCSYWQQTSNPSAECYRPPAAPSQEQGQAQGQAQGQGQAQSADADAAAKASAAAIAAQQQAASAEASNAGNGNGNVNVGGTTSDYNSKALALALPGLVAAPAVAQQCMLHSRGWGGFSAGATGGTYFDAACMARVNCLALADRYASWNRADMAMKQLESCGGVTVVSVPAASESQFVTHEELNQAFKRSVQK